MKEKQINSLLNNLDKLLSRFGRKRLPLFSALYSIFIAEGMSATIKTIPKLFQHATNSAIVKKDDIINIINNISKILGPVAITGGSAHIIYGMNNITNDIDITPLNYKSDIKKEDLDKLKKLGFIVNYMTNKNTCLKDIKTGIDIDIQNTKYNICYRPGINFINEEDLKANLNKIDSLLVVKPNVLILLDFQAIIYSNKVYIESKLGSRFKWLVEKYYRNFDNFVKEEKEFLEKHCTDELLSNVYKYAEYISLNQANNNLLRSDINIKILSNKKSKIN
ncbi:MAG: hypothetical protein ACP5LH_01385 [Candidatus Micrarchaeia archaeon]